MNALRMVGSFRGSAADSRPALARTPRTSGRAAMGLKSPPRGGPASAQERRDVDLVVADLERRALTLVHARAAVARTDVLARGARRAAPVEPGGDDRHPDLVGHGL